MEALGRILVGAGAVIALVGVVLLVTAKLGLTRIPGDLTIRRGNFTLYAPIGLMILLSVIITVALNLFLRR